MLQKRLKFTDLILSSLAYTDATTYVWDTHAPGLGLRIGKRTKTFVAIKPDRKRLTLGKYPYICLLDARKRHAAIKYGNCLGASPHSTALIASYAVEQYLQSHSSKARASTLKQTERILSKRFLPVFADRPLDLITTNDLTAVIDPIARAAPSEANAVHAKLNTFFNWCVRRQMIARNPLAIVPRPAPIPERERVLTDRELAAVLKAALSIAHTPYGAILLILMHTGLRRNEAYELRRQRITSDTITIPKELAKNGVELVLPNTIGKFLAVVPNTGNRLFPETLHWHSAKLRFNAKCGFADWRLHRPAPHAQHQNGRVGARDARRGGSHPQPHHGLTLPDPACLRPAQQASPDAPRTHGLR